MKKEQLSDALDLLDDSILEETDQLRNLAEKPKESSRGESGKISSHARLRSRQKWIATVAAACLLPVIYMGLRTFPPHMQSDPSNPSQPAPGGSGGLVPSPGGHAGNLEDLPLLPITTMEGETNGYEGYVAYDISELVNGNPWTEDLALSTLPVYENPLSYDDFFLASGADFDKMRGFLTEIAERLGLDAETYPITDDTPDEETQKIITEKFEGDVPDGYFNPTKLILQADGLKIEVDQEMTAEVSFEPARPLPDGYSFTFYSPYEDMTVTADYLLGQYRNLIGITEPRTDISGGDYDIYLRQGYHIAFFEGEGDILSQILHYNFNPISFYCNDKGQLSFIRIRQPDLSKKAGDYPVITADEAKSLLGSGNFVTSVPYEMPGIEYVRKAELVYRTGRREQYFMPYYRFLVELPDESLPKFAKENGLRHYGAYYVPAVESTYLISMPVWDGSFN